MEVIKNFGVNVPLLIAQIVNFLIILYLLKRFAYKPILEVLEKRRKTIAEGEKNAQKANEALAKALDEEKKLLRNAQSEAKNMITEAAKQAETLIAQAHEKAKQQSEKLIKDTKEQLDRDRKETEKQLATKTAELAVQMLEKSLTGFFDPKQQKDVVEKATKALKK